MKIIRPSINETNVNVNSQEPLKILNQDTTLALLTGIQYGDSKGTRPVQEGRWAQPVKVITRMDRKDIKHQGGQLYRH